MSNPVFTFLDSMSITPESRNSLSQNLVKVHLGNSTALYSPLNKEDFDAGDILNAWDEIFERNLSGLNEELLSSESSNREKYGPRSIAKPWSEREDSLDEYFFSDWTPERIDNFIVDRSQKSGRLRPISFDKALNLLKNGTSSGLPFMLRKSKVKPTLLTNYDSIPDYPCVLFTRTQEGNKTRNIWGFPIKDTLREMRFYKPLLDYQKQVYWRSAIVSPEETDKRITRILKKAARMKNATIISIDFSAFDASINPSLIHMAFEYIRGLFQQEYHEEILEIERRFMTIPIVTPSGIKEGFHGVPSGSTFTNEIDSLVQFVIANVSGMLLGDSFQIQGDDGVYLILDEHVDLFIALFESFGLKVNLTKSVIAKDHCTYLQKLYHPDYTLSDGTVGGIYSTYRALNRLVHQERWSNFETYGISGQDYYSLRAISILENCKYHPLFPELVRFVLEIDKFNLQYDESSLSKYCQMLKEGPGSGGAVATESNQYGGDTKGIHNFATIKLIKQLLS